MLPNSSIPSLVVIKDVVIDFFHFRKFLLSDFLKIFLAAFWENFHIWM